MLKQINLFFLVFLIFSCDSCNHTRTYHLPKIHKENILDKTEPKKFQSSDIIWEKPESWIASKGSSMRMASFQVPFSTGFGDLSIMKLGGEGGGIVANVNRWRQQIGLGPLIETQIMKQAYYGESDLGSYQVFKLTNDSNSDVAMLAAILPMNNSTLYIKLTASKDGIEDLEEDFKIFCTSFKPKIDF